MDNAVYGEKQKTEEKTVDGRMVNNQKYYLK